MARPNLTTAGLVMIVTSVTLCTNALAHAPGMINFQPVFESQRNVVPVANKLQKALKALKKPFKSAPQSSPSAPARQPGLNQIIGNPRAAAPKAPQKAPSQPGSNTAENPYGVIPPPKRSASNPYGNGPPQRTNYDRFPPPNSATDNGYSLAGVPQFPNGPYANIPRGQRNGPYGNIPTGQRNGPYGNVPTGQPNGPYGNIPTGQPNGPYGNIPRGEFPNGPYGNIPTGQQAGGANSGYAPIDPKLFRDGSAGSAGSTSPGYQRFDTTLFKDAPNGLPAQIRRLPTRRMDDFVSPANSPNQAKELRKLERGIAKDTKIIRGGAVGIGGATLLLGGLGTYTILNMTNSETGE